MAMAIGNIAPSEIRWGLRVGWSPSPGCVAHCLDDAQLLGVRFFTFCNLSYCKLPRIICV